MNKLFVTLDDLKFRMTINPELEGVDENLESAISAAQLRIEVFLDSKLNKTAYVTKFYLDKDAYSGNQVAGLFRCYLKTGFVLADPAITVMCGSAWNSIETVVPTTDYYVDPAKGVLYISDGYADKFISASYSAGFNKASEIPDWLKECIIGYAPVVLNFSQAAKNSQSEEGGYKTSADHALAIAAPHTRNVGFLIRPVF
jgi:hypothetical protein